MRRLTKAVVTALCLGTLCSSMFCANTLCVSAAEKVDGIKPIEMVATDENDYFAVTDDLGYVTVKKAGYYAVVLKSSRSSDTPFYVSVTSGDSILNVETHEEIYGSFDKAKVFNQYAEGDTLYVIAKRNSEDEYYVIYSEDGITTSSVLCVTSDMPDLQPVEDTTPYTPVFSNIKLSESEEKATFSADLSVSEGVIDSVEVRALTEDYYETLEFIPYSNSKESFKYEFIQNGTFEVWCYSDSGESSVQTVEVKGISTSVTIDDPYTDSESPNLTIEFDTSKKGLKEGADLFAITVKSNEVCNICVGTMSKADTTEFTGYVYSNGVYTITATDSWGNTTTEEVKVTAFGDGSMPSVDDINNVVGLANENPLNDSNRNTYWASVSDDGSLLDEGSSVLPQTGSPTWYALTIGGSVVLIAGGAFTVKRVGIFRRKGGTKK